RGPWSVPSEGSHRHNQGSCLLERRLVHTGDALRGRHLEILVPVEPGQRGQRIVEGDRVHYRLPGGTVALGGQPVRLSRHFPILRRPTTVSPPSARLGHPGGSSDAGPLHPCWGRAFADVSLADLLLWRVSHLYGLQVNPVGRRGY